MDVNSRAVSLLVLKIGSRGHYGWGTPDIWEDQSAGGQKSWRGQSAKGRKCWGDPTAFNMFHMNTELRRKFLILNCWSKHKIRTFCWCFNILRCTRSFGGPIRPIIFGQWFWGLGLALNALICGLFVLNGNDPYKNKSEWWCWRMMQSLPHLFLCDVPAIVLVKGLEKLSFWDNNCFFFFSKLYRIW